MRLFLVLAVCSVFCHAEETPNLIGPLPIPLPIDIPATIQGLNPLKLLDMFKQFRMNFKKNYETPLLEAKALETFTANVKRIIKLQTKQLTFELGLNQFSDLTDDEFASQVLMHNPAPPKNVSNYGRSNKRVPGSLVKRPKEFDYRKIPNVVGPVQNQQSCGCCWAFSAAALIQSYYGIKYKKLISLSEQQLCDCGTMSKNWPGCKGGNVANAFEFAMTSGVVLENNYTPFDPARSTKPNTCAAVDNKITRVKIRDYNQMSPADADEIVGELLFTGPIGAAFRVGPSFRFYKSGIYSSDDCDTDEKGTHAITIVGYGEEGGKQYWIVKNSWGPSFGENGYFRFAKGYDLCSMESLDLLYPIY